MNTYATIGIISYLIAIVLFLAIIIGAVTAIIFIIKHLIKFTAHTIYEEKAKAEERHRQNNDDREEMK